MTPTTRAFVVALACERPSARNVPLSRCNISELTREVADRLNSETFVPSRSSIWRVLSNHALRPWRHRPGSFRVTRIF